MTLDWTKVFAHALHYSYGSGIIHTMTFGNEQRPYSPITHEERVAETMRRMQEAAEARAAKRREAGLPQELSLINVVANKVAQWINSRRNRPSKI